MNVDGFITEVAAFGQVTLERSRQTTPLDAWLFGFQHGQQFALSHPDLSRELVAALCAAVAEHRGLASPELVETYIQQGVNALAEQLQRERK